MTDEKIMQRYAVLDAVLEEFNEKGFRFTMDDIAKHMGMSKKTLYVIYKDKNEMFDEMVNYVFEGIKEEEQRILERNDLDIVEKIKQVMIALPHKFDEINLVQIAKLEEKYPKIYAKVKKRIEGDWEPTLNLLEQGMKEGRIRRISLSILKAMVEGTIEQFFHTDVLLKSKTTYRKALENMMDILLQGMEIK